MDPPLSANVPAPRAFPGVVDNPKLEQLCRSNMISIKRVAMGMLWLIAALLLTAFVLMYFDQEKQTRGVLQTGAAVVLATALFIMMDAYVTNDHGYFAGAPGTTLALMVALVLAAVSFFFSREFSTTTQLMLLAAALGMLYLTLMYNTRVIDSTITTGKMPGYLGQLGYDRFIQELDWAIDKAIFDGKINPEAATGLEPQYAAMKNAMVATRQAASAEDAVAKVKAYLAAANATLTIGAEEQPGEIPNPTPATLAALAQKQLMRVLERKPGEMETRAASRGIMASAFRGAGPTVATRNPEPAGETKEEYAEAHETRHLDSGAQSVPDRRLMRLFSTAPTSNPAVITPPVARQAYIYQPQQTPEEVFTLRQRELLATAGERAAAAQREREARAAASVAGEEGGIR